MSCPAMPLLNICSDFKNKFLVNIWPKAEFYIINMGHVHWMGYLTKSGSAGEGDEKVTFLGGERNELLFISRDPRIL